ncbi:MAG: AI-2E family transporter [Gemmatimonadota bacterium]|nr:AI-2E family transporter [Gemmatimonadota bacterium]
MIARKYREDLAHQRHSRRRLIILALVATVLLSGAVWVMMQVGEVVILFAITFLLFYMVDPIIVGVERLTRVNRLGAIIIFYFACLVLVGLGIVFLLPLIRDQFNTAYALLNDEKVRAESFNRIRWVIEQNLPFIPVADLKEQIAEFGSAAISDVAKILLNILSFFSLLVVVPFILFFFLKDSETMRKQIISKVPNRFFEMSLNLIHTIDRNLGTYIRGQLMVAGWVGTLSTIALWILGIPYFFIIGMLAGLANMIPYLGPIAGLVPAIAVSIVFFDGLNPFWAGGYNALWEPVTAITCAFVVIQVIDNIALSPFIVSNSTDLHPLTVIATVLVGSGMFGLIGMLLGVPLVSIAKVVTRDMIWHFQNYKLL